MLEWELFYLHYNQASISTRKLNSDAFLFLVHGSYGDIFLNLSLLKEVINKNGRHIVAILDEKWRYVTSRFDHPQITFHFVANEQVLRNSLMSEGRHYMFIPGLLYPLLATLHPLIADTYFEGYLSDLELKRIILRLPRNTPFSVNQIPTSKQHSLAELFDTTGCRRGQTCVISFENNSNPSLDPEIIADVIRYLSHCNIDILFNIASTFDKPSWVPEFAKEFPSVKVPGDAPMEFIELAGAHLGTLNGLTAILAHFHTRAKLGLIADCRSETIVNNGKRVQSARWLLLSQMCPQDIAKENDYTEFLIDKNSDTFLGDRFISWAQSLFPRN